MDKIAILKELRARTNAGMVDCKQALENNDYDIEKAITWLKSSGKIKAAKRADKISAEGSLAIAANETKAVLVEMNCETDFVAQNDKFKALVNTVAQTILASNVTEVAQALELKIGNETLNDYIEENSARIGEKLSLRRFAVVESKEGESLGHFVHINGQIGAIVKVQGQHDEASRNVAMHAAAMKPEFVFEKDLPAAKLEQFKAEFVVPAGFDKKPEKIQQMIMEGSLNKKLLKLL